MSGARRILFVTSNGTGLGHLTRSMAIARRLDAASSRCSSRSRPRAPVVREQGFPVEYIASYDRPGRRDRPELDAPGARPAAGDRGAEIEPEVVVFDGTHPYERLLPALRSTGARAGLVPARDVAGRRRHGAAPPHAPVRRGARARASSTPEADRGPTAGAAARRTRSTRSCCSTAATSRGAPRPSASWACEPGQRNVLVQLGQGAGVREATARCLRHLAAMPGVQVAALASHLAALDDVPGGRRAARGRPTRSPAASPRSTPPSRPPATTPSTS